MSEQVMPFVGGQPDFLSLVNAEVEKVEPVIKASLTPPDEQPPSLVPHESLPTPTERPKEVQHLKASNFTEPTLPIDWLSQCCLPLTHTPIILVTSSVWLVSRVVTRLDH